MQKLITLIAVLLLASCGKKEENHSIMHVAKPKVSDNGNLIVLKFLPYCKTPNCPPGRRTI